ncbi:efflux RND transporter periplasmic adaptor subunit [Staphylococcus hominis]|uniref:efflux RND transporter periplasmic adaptor subunit n=1 Tax=Staphylococcus hominis TaxID=1290 RepID=UPI00119C92B1|nr:efflux RND transporter periplasmic adaptor subunit [Staphylococcus hominis]
MRRKLPWILGILGILSLLIIASLVKNNFSDDSNKEGYKVYKVEKENPLNLEGKASPHLVKTYNNNNQIGTYVSTQVDDGQSVTQGDKLINYNMDNSKFQQLTNKVNEAQSKVNEDYNSINQNPNNNNLQKELIQDQILLRKSQQQLINYNQQVDDSIYADFDGKIDIENSGNVSEGKPILQLVSNETQIKTTVSEFDLDKIKKGDKVNIKVISNGKTGEGEIKKISELPKDYEDKSNGLNDINDTNLDSSTDESSTTTQSLNPVDTDLSSGDGSKSSEYTIIIGDIDIPVRAGYSTEIEIPLDSIKLPKSVLTRDNKVFVLNKDNKVEKRNITLDKVNGEIFVKKGIKKGDNLIKAPKKTMNDGDKVEVKS